MRAGLAAFGASAVYVGMLARNAAINAVPTCIKLMFCHAGPKNIAAIGAFLLKIAAGSALVGIRFRHVGVIAMMIAKRADVSGIGFE